MEELIEWRPHKPGITFIKDIILHFNGREYPLGRATQKGYGSGDFWWQFTWETYILRIMDNAVYNLRLDEPLEPTQKQINEWVVLNLWKIVRELRKRDEGVS